MVVCLSRIETKLCVVILGVDMVTTRRDILGVTLKGGCMEELSWRAKLAKSNINILNITEDAWYYEFMYHPRQGQTKWCKTFYVLKPGEDRYYLSLTKSWTQESDERIAGKIMKEVLALRKELER